MKQSAWLEDTEINQDHQPMNRKLNQKVELDDPMGLGPKSATVLIAVQLRKGRKQQQRALRLTSSPDPSGPLLSWRPGVPSCTQSKHGLVCVHLEDSLYKQVHKLEENNPL